MNQRFLASLVLPLLLFSCSKDKDDEANKNGENWSPEILLSDSMAPEGCLSIPRLYDAIRRVSPSQPVVSIPTAIAFESDRAIRENFKKVISNGQLTITQPAFSDLQAFPAVTQEACEKFTLTSQDGAEKVFTVKEKSETSLSGEAEDGERFAYTWLSPRSFESKRRYIAFDVPCMNQDKPIFVTIEKTYIWQDNSIPATLPEKDSPLAIEPNFIRWAAAAVGVSAESVYEDGDDGARVISVPKVLELSEKPLLAEVLSCNGLAPQPTDPNDPPRDDDDHGNDGDNGESRP